MSGLEQDQFNPSVGGGGAEVASVITYTADTPPSGYLLCDGSLLDRATYADLYAIIGDAYGNGDGSTTFQIPDFRGKFLRGTDSGAGQDPNAATRIASGAGGNIGDAIGSGQANEGKSHRHYSGFSTASSSSVHYYGGTYQNWGSSRWRTKGDSYETNNFRNIGFTQTVGGSESRPINVNINYMIKY